jgi:hypothetical protein
MEETHQNNSKFLNTNSNAKTAWNDIFQALKENNRQPGIVYPAKLSFIIKEEIKTFYSK